MATKGLRRTIERLRHSLIPPDLTDEQLLQRFLGERSEAAFAGLVRRHGPMVLGVCRRVLGNLHDSEDVFQAVFLVLAQKARSVVSRESISSWLYKVAYRIALKLRARNSRRQQREKQVNVMPDPHTTPAVVADWEVVLDEELNRLPAKYREPLILCDLEGRTGKEAERQLHLKPGTLSSRLTAGRRLLAQRLSRRGISLGAGLGAALAEAGASAALPAGLVGTTSKAAVLVSTGQLAGIAGSVLVLMKIGAKAMFLAKLKATLATVVVLAFVGGGIVYSGGAGQAQPKTDYDSLRRENQLLKVNQRALLERIESLEKQLAAKAPNYEQALANDIRARRAEEEARGRELQAARNADLTRLRAQRMQEEAAKAVKESELRTRLLEAERDRAILVEKLATDRAAAKAAKETELMRRLLEVEKASIPYPTTKPEVANPATKPADPNSARVNLNKNLYKIADDPLLPESVRRAAREALRMKRGSNRPGNELPKEGSADNVPKGS